jgi:hypothetical protein
MSRSHPSFLALVGSLLLAGTVLTACGGATPPAASSPAGTSGEAAVGSSTGSTPGTTSAAATAPSWPHRLQNALAKGHPHHRRPTRTAHAR